MIRSINVKIALGFILLTLAALIGASRSSLATSKNTASASSFPGMPYRQDDPQWGNDIMWNRDIVIKVATKFNKYTQPQAAALLRKFDDGNTIANEGCQLTALAMILRLTHPEQTKNPWTPRTLNAKAQELYYYTPSGLSMTTLYADLVSDVTQGDVQLVVKEEYLSGEKGWPKKFANTSPLVRAYRKLSLEARRNIVVMIKTGTHDDTVASHYVLLHPGSTESPDNDDPEILDPAQPLGATGPWRLSDSAKRIGEDNDIKKEWIKKGIESKQIAGVWVFARWPNSRERSLSPAFIQAWASELTK